MAQGSTNVEVVVPQPQVARAARAYDVVAGLVAIVVLAQAVLAGQFLYRGWAIAVHGIIGNLAFTLALALLALAVAGRLGRRRVVAGALLAALMTAQIGLGYSTESVRAAGAWHIPLGVAIFGLAIYNLAGMSWRGNETRDEYRRERQYRRA